MQRIDFVQRNSAPWAARLLLIAGGLSLAGALWLQHRWDAVRASQEERLLAQAQAAEASRKAVQAAQRPTPDQLRMRNVAPLLRQPWLPILRVIEHATEPPVYLLSLFIDPAAGTVRVEGEAGSFDQVLAYARTLDDDSVLGPARLGSHESITDAAGRTLVRFSITTPWRTR
ncbi:hypothetical protein H5407_17350 [Mitsuaria sp. WAJ17]|uniref:hypothetical protein n=1 Tax=Mitsuaria sp. WAJ17 TaxID=2761452 RepID=UPI00160453C9|nr:hypothetical protein [Mitsuaria sp. WAJ17]MBB2486998.1 hypothetical protein [Mitsuaria sp. WAJ17]